MEKQRIYLTEDDSLVVITDNGILTKDGTATKTEGTFEVSAVDVAKLYGADK